MTSESEYDFPAGFDDKEYNSLFMDDDSENEESKETTISEGPVSEGAICCHPGTQACLISCIEWRMIIEVGTE